MRFKSFICKYLSFERKYIQNNRQQKSFHLEMTFVNVSFQIIMSFLLTNFTNSTFVQGERRSQVYLDYAEPQPNVCWKRTFPLSQMGRVQTCLNILPRRENVATSNIHRGAPFQCAPMPEIVFIIPKQIFPSCLIIFIICAEKVCYKLCNMYYKVCNMC